MRSMVSGPPTENLSGKTRVELREEARRQRAQEAHDDAKRRALGSRLSLVDEVNRAVLKLGNANVSQAIEHIEAASNRDRDILLLAEEAGKNRATVLRAFGPVRRVVRETYDREVAMKQAPNQTPEWADTALD